jgi:hypothetical protein
MNDHSGLNEPSRIPAIWADSHAAGFAMASEPLTPLFRTSRVEYLRITDGLRDQML